MNPQTRPYFGLLIIMMLCNGAAKGAVIQVNTAGDNINMDTRCTLREAIIAANTDTLFMGCPAGSGDDVIELVADGPYEMSIAGANEDGSNTGDFDIRWNTTIRPSTNGKRTIDAAGLDRVFEVFDGARLTLERVNLTGGQVVGFGGGIFSQHPGNDIQLVRSEIYNNTASLFGGGVYSSSDVTMTRSSIEFNDAAVGAGVHMGSDASLVLLDTTIKGNEASSDGGGISAISLIAENSTISGNHAGRFGGGIHLRGAARGVSNLSTLTNSTVGENEALEHGGGIYKSGAGSLEIISSTVVYNICDSDENDNGDGCGLYVDNGQVLLANALLGNNEDLTDSGNYAPDCHGPITSGGYNLISMVDSNDCVITGDLTGNQTGTIGASIDPQLDCLQDNGGSSSTYMPMVDSPLIDAADPMGCFDAFDQPLLTDQREHQRVWDGPDADDDPRCDIGSVEYDAPEYTDVIFYSGFGDDDDRQTEGGGCFPE